MRDVVQDIRYSLRTWLHAPFAPSVALLALCLGIGANTAVFSVFNAILIRPLPYKDAERLVVLWENKLSKGMRQQPVSAADFRDLAQDHQLFERIGAFQTQSAALMTSAMAEQVDIAAVSPSIFELLGMQTAVGRTFAAEEDQPANNSVAILSNGFWRRRFGGNRNAVGMAIRLDSKSYTIIGIAPPGFRLLDTASEVWIPYTPGPAQLRRRGLRTLTVIARPKSGVTKYRLNNELRAIAQTLAQDYPDSNAGYGFEAIALRDQMTGDLRPTLWALTGAVTFVLLIACANVANLLLARAGDREKEIALRAALGANPARIMRQLLTESILLASIGGALGLGLAQAILPLVLNLAPATFLRGREVSVDWRVALFALCASLLTGILFGLAPAFSALKVDLNFALKSSGRSSTGNRGRSKLRAWPDCWFAALCASPMYSPASAPTMS